MKKQYRVILAAALVLSLAGCHTQESRIDPEGSAGQGTGTTQESGATQGGTAQAISGEVPPHCEEAAKEAASNCPVSVIHID